MADGSSADGARVVVRNDATGFATQGEVRGARFLVQGLEPGGPYSVAVRRIGAFAWRADSLFLGLGKHTELDVTLAPSPVELDSVLVVSHPGALSCCHGGTATTLSDSLIYRLPSLNRNVYDFLRLVPQVSTRIGFPAGGISGGGVGFRFNGFLTNGVPQRSIAGGQPPEFAGGRSLPFEAVREYQVLIAPFDVRYGDFAGALINTVTRSGTNRFAGSAFALGRSDALGRNGELGASPYERWQYGLSFSGPISRDRAHFFIATELQSLSSPMIGPFVGQPADASQPVPVAETDLARLENIMAAQGLEAGSGREISNRNRLTGIFARVDGLLPAWNTRAVAWLNDTRTRNRVFSRETAPQTFTLSSHAAEQAMDTRTGAIQLYTTLGGAGAHNELSLSQSATSFGSIPVARQPIVRVIVPAVGGGTTTIVTGTPVQAQGVGIESRQLVARDHLTVPFGPMHVAGFGLEAAWFRIGPSGLQNAYGEWTFQSVDSLAAGVAERFQLARDFGSAGVPLSAGQFGAYAGDAWRVTDRLDLTFGLRADILAVRGRAPYNPLVDSLFGRRTDDPVRRRVHLSPRLGFTWDPRGSGSAQLRGGLGIFTGRPPMGWIHVPLQSYGDGIGLLRCGNRSGDLGAPPAFHPDPLDPPTTCSAGEGVTTAPPGDVELVDPDLRMGRTLRGVVAWEQRLSRGLVGTIEGVLTRHRSDFVFVNLNLAGPQTKDRWGRVLYGTIDTLGVAVPVRVTTRLPSVIELRNVSRNHALQVSGSLAKQFEDGFAAVASYTWSRVRDVQTPLRVNNRGLVNWSLRAVSGRHDDFAPGISLNDVPHRVIAAGTWRAPGRRWLTEVSLLYVGESGSPFTYLAGGPRGDLNADGERNDPVYVPRDARDAAEIVFSGQASGPDSDNSPAAQAARVTAQQAAFEEFIAASGCLRRHRGRILEANSCREPWAHTTAASLRQTIPLGARAVELQLDVFNPLNLLDGDWGRRRLANAVLLQHVGQTTGASGQAEPVFRFDSGSAGWIVDPAESAFQLQLGARYRF